MKTLALFATFLLLSQANGDSPAKLMDSFSPEKNPGSGVMTYLQNGKAEKIPLGPEKGLYALGMRFSGNMLPAPYSQSFKDHEVLQVIMGTLRNQIQFQVPQFGSATLVFKTGAAMPVLFSFEKTPKVSSKPAPLAFLLFTSPATLNNQSDEAKLKGTYFSQSGTAKLQEKGKSQILETSFQGKRVAFMRQTMKLELNTSLSTPFNAQENSLKGDIEFPVYTPYGPAAEAIAKKMARDSFTSLVTPMATEGLSKHNRNVAGSSKQNTDKEAQ